MRRKLAKKLKTKLGEIGKKIRTKIGKKIRGEIGAGDFEEKLGNKLCLGVQILKMRAI